jgi:hypothetical protein
MANKAMRSVNPFGKTRDLDNPYAVYKNWYLRMGECEYRVLKTYKLSKNENEYSRWLVAGKSEATYGKWEYGDMYRYEIEKHFHLTSCDPEWEETYAP